MPINPSQSALVAAFLVLGVSGSSADLMNCPIVVCEDEEVARAGINGTFTGVYSLGFELSEFQPSGSECRWWLRGNIEPIWAATGSREEMESASVRIAVEGSVSEPGCYGHTGMYRRALTVTRIVSAQVQASEGRDWMPLSLPTLPTRTPRGPLPAGKLRE